MNQWLSRFSDWYGRHPRMLLLILPLLFGAYVFAREMLSIHNAVPPSPIGKLQIVGLTLDGAQFVALDNRVEEDGKLRADVLITFEKPLKVDGDVMSFEARREWIDCAKSVIEPEGAGFYDEHGKEVTTRYFSRKPEAVTKADLEVNYLCRGLKIDVPPVTGYLAAMQLGRDARAALKSGTR